MAKDRGSSRTQRRMGTKSAMHLKCQRLTRGARKRARREIGMK